MYKKFGIVFSLQATITLISMIIIFSGGIYIGTTTINNYRTVQIMNECDAIDRGLEMYAKSHQSISAIKKDSSGQKLIYEHSKVYPENLSELGAVQSEQGYFTTKINLNRFTYQTKKDTEGKMIYELGVTLPNGHYYTSPRSNK